MGKRIGAFSARLQAEEVFRMLKVAGNRGTYRLACSHLEKMIEVKHEKRVMEIIAEPKAMDSNRRAVIQD